MRAKDFKSPLEKLSARGQYTTTWWPGGSVDSSAFVNALRCLLDLDPLPVHEKRTRRVARLSR